MSASLTDRSTELPASRRRRWWRIPLVLATIAMIFWISGCMERLFYYPTAGLTPPPRHVRGAESVTFRSADGTNLHGWFIPAQGVATERTAPLRPTIIHAHGNAGNITSHIGFTDYLPHAGFNLFIFDYRGYGQSEGRARARQPLIADTHAALDYVLSRADVDPQLIGVYGQSLGGTIALNVMAERTELRAAVIESAFVSWRGMAACALGGDQPGLVCRALSGLLIPDTYRADDAIGKIDHPILLLHGSADSIVPVSNSRALAAAAKPARAKLIELPGGDHNSLRESHPQVERTVVQFFREHLER